MRFPGIPNKYSFLLLAGPILAIALLGCSLPVVPDDDAFETFGGIVEREHPSMGRVNSAFEVPKPPPILPTDLSDSGSMSSELDASPFQIDPARHSPLIP